MRLTVLGNQGPFPSVGGACSSYLLESDSGLTNILLDCGTGALQALTGQIPLSKLDAVILSHLHFDHMSDMLPMQYALQFDSRKKPLDVYAPMQPSKVRTLLDCPHFDLWPMREVTIGEMKVTFCMVRHPIDTYAIRVYCDHSYFVYTGDSNTCFELELFSDQADLILADAGLSEADYTDAKPHMSPALCAQLAQSTNSKHLLLTHLNPKYDPEKLLEEARPYFSNVDIAERGKTYVI